MLAAHASRFAVPILKLICCGLFNDKIICEMVGLAAAFIIFITFNVVFLGFKFWLIGYKPSYVNGQIIRLLNL